MRNPGRASGFLTKNPGHLDFLMTTSKLVNPNPPPWSIGLGAAHSCKVCNGCCKNRCTEAGVGQVRGSPLWRRMPYSVLFSKELFLFSSCNQKARLSVFVTLSLPCSYSFLLRIDYLSQKKKKNHRTMCCFL